MKIRHGWVSNSSSSSFVVLTEGLTSKQINLVTNHKDEMQRKRCREWYKNEENAGSETEFIDPRDSWMSTYDEANGKIYVSTDMTNFDLEFYCTNYCKIPRKNLVNFKED